MTPLDRLKQTAKAAVIFPIRIYQKFISPCFPARCKYHPSCSAYAVQAVKKHGAVKGMLLGMFRIARCNPFSRGGVDYVPEKFDLFYRFKIEK